MRSSPLPIVRTRESSADPVAIERRVLRQICHAKLTHAGWDRIARALGEYTWREIEHGLVYAAILRLGSRDPKTLREQLPAQATRMGFPEIDWQTYFRAAEKPPAGPSVDQLVRPIKRLIASSRAAATRGGDTPKHHRRSA
jgi:hypothetical protein